MHIYTENWYNCKINIAENSKIEKHFDTEKWYNCIITCRINFNPIIGVAMPPLCWVDWLAINISKTIFFYAISSCNPYPSCVPEFLTIWIQMI